MTVGSPTRTAISFAYSVFDACLCARRLQVAELVTHAPHGQDHLRSRRIVLDFPAEPVDVAVPVVFHAPFFS